ncbi:MAG TPA: RNA-binding cell elongation regulator Jag/EloR [Desulfobacteraceae bacterium]|nr:RNA-binding cell elongation regulator Jag/EloR [Desulfobacteraceae bacterium]HPJ66539.1 RNA-binding cell elongation regulator Jag/EloR [Desulfobacteraceae bacterium]HPQ27495.1 RNA-binding cell elongation regulator Jag/EloR [Desulfobacteraceae bacterium]
MTETYEFQAKNTEEAIEIACSELNVSTDDIEIEIIEPGSAGIFGLVGGKKARIRVKLIKESAESNDNDYGIAIARETLEKILALIPVESTKVTSNHTGDRVVLTIEGDTSGLLIGRKGRTLDALQFIVNRIANKNLEKRIHVVIDSENYRQRRKDSLIQTSLRMGDKAKKIGKPVTTNLLNPHDRRIVHLALKEDEELNTKSIGKDGALKKVVIIPRKYNGQQSTRL